jgi:hypothetical protein
MEGDHLGWRRLLGAIANRVGRKDLAANLPPPADRKGVGKPLLIGLAAVLVLALGAGAFMLTRGQPTPPTQASATGAPAAATGSLALPTPTPGEPAKPAFVMVDEEQTFGKAERYPFTVTFPPGSYKTPGEGEKLFDDLATRFQNAKLEGVDILGPQIRDENLGVLRDRRIATLSEGFISRGVTPNAIAISYEPRNREAGDTYDAFKLTVYFRTNE